MDEDLKIILTSELEADEQASAQRISAQLPNIAKLINSKSSIKVGVTLDEAGIQSQAQRIPQQITKVTKTQSIGVTLNLDQSSVNKIKTELNNLKVSPDISRAMTDQLDQMGIQIDRITGRWEAVNGEEERMLNLTIQGTDQLQRTVTYMQTYNVETGEINTHLTNVTANLERQRKEQEQVAAQAKKDNESRVSYLNRQKSLLADIQAAYVGQTSVKPITDSAHLTVLNDTYAAVNAQIETMISAEGRLDNVQRSNLEAQIAGLQRLVKEYQNAEYVATKLRTKDIGSIKADQLSGLETLEKRLESAGTLTDTFKRKIDALKTALQGVGTKDQLVAFLNSFDQLNNDVAVFQERLRGVNKIYTQLISLDKKITSVQSAMTKLNSSDDQDKLLALQGQLAVLNNQKASLEAQLAPYADIIQYAEKATALEQNRLLNGTQLVYAQMELADKAREYDAAMQKVPTTITDLETKMRQVVSPTETLVQNMELLRQTQAQYSADMSDKEKVQTYERLQQLISSCGKEMSELLRIQRSDVNDFKFTQNLEKAKADLATVGRQWSALKSDPGLNAQFIQLGENLKRVQTQTDLTKWTAQFSTFKSEVKAAGKNMQSLGDILKNNVSKVLQWVSATTLLFRAFRLLKSALTTIVDLDTAMIDLRKTTDATEAEYREFYFSANETAKALGVTTEEIISQTAEWSRLGYAMADAAKMAENSAIFSSISPELETQEATDGLISIMKAYGYEAEDMLDGVISKINKIGNEMAVSNADIVEVMTRSSSAMAAANNTFEETVALATAAIEITRDATSVGTGLKTLSMRIRGYDEETEEYSEDVAALTGAIADLTKVASNNNRGVSLFEPGDPDTYRSTYDILSDIADIWDELTDKNQAQLLEALFGKRQAQIGAAILSNFDSAVLSIEKMENAAGSADAEMEKIYSSLEYKLNALQQTWVGVSQNLFQTDDMKLVVDALTLVSNGIDQLTERLGLFGTVTMAGVIAWLLKFRTTLGTINTAVMPVFQTLSNVSFDGSAASTLRYVTALNTLDATQQKLVMDMLGLSTAQKEQILTMSAAVAAVRQYTVAELEHELNMEAGTLANELNIASTAMVTDEVLKAALAHGILKEEQLKSIVATNTQTAANEKQALSWKKLGATMKATSIGMLTNPMGWITIALGVLPLLIQRISKLIVTQKEAYDSAEELRSQYESFESEVDSLNDELNTTKIRITELQTLANNGTITIVEKEELEDLKAYNAELETRIANEKLLAEQAAKEANEGYVEAYNKNSYTSIDVDNAIDDYDALYEANRDLIQGYEDYMSGSGDWYDLSEEELDILLSQYSEINAQLEEYRKHWDGVATENVDYATHVQELVDRYTELNDLQENGITLSKAQSDQMASIKIELANLFKDLDENYLAKYVGEDENTAAWQQLLDLISKTIYAVEYFNEKLAELPDECYQQLTELGAGAQLTAEEVNQLAEKFPELAEWMSESGYTAEDVAANFNALSIAQKDAGKAAEYAKKSFTDIYDSLEDGLKAITDAQEEMAESGYLSVESIKAIEAAGLTEYLEEAEGGYKLAQGALDDYVASQRIEYEYALNEATSAAEQVINNSALEAAGYDTTTMSIYDQIKAMQLLAAAKMAEISTPFLAKYIAEGFTSPEANHMLSSNPEYQAAFEYWKQISDIVKDIDAAQSNLDTFNRVVASYQRDSVSSSSSSSDPWKEEFEAYYNAHKHAVAMEQETLEEFYAWLDGQDGYKKYFANNEKYLDEYRQYSEEVFEGLRELAEDHISDLEHNITLWENQGGHENDIVDTCKQIMDIAHETAEAFREAKRALGWSEEDIENSDFVQGWQDQWWDAYNDIKDTMVDSYESSIQELENGITLVENHLNEAIADKDFNAINVYNNQIVSYYKKMQEIAHEEAEYYRSLGYSDYSDEVSALSDAWYDYAEAIQEAKQSTIDALADMVTEASEAIDTIQNVYDTLIDAADEYAENGGFISVDALQAIRKLGPEYMQYLRDENGLLVINTENINKVIAAKTQQLAVESAMTYVDRLRLALQEDSIEDLNQLLFATTESTDATWGLVYANLALLDLNGEQYDAALHNINAIRALADTAVSGIGQATGSVTEELNCILRRSAATGAVISGHLAAQRPPVIRWSF